MGNFLTVAEAADRLHLAPVQMVRLIESGKIRTQLIGDMEVIMIEEFDRYVLANARNASGQKHVMEG